MKYDSMLGMKTRLKMSNGFTPVELLVVVAIIAVLALVQSIPPGFFPSAVIHGGGGTSIREIAVLQKSGSEATPEIHGSLAVDGFCTTTIHSNGKHSKLNLRFAIHPELPCSLMAVADGGIG